VTTREAFQVVAALGAAAAILGLLVPARLAGGRSPRQAGALAVCIGSWGLLIGSLVSRDDLDSLGDRLDSLARIGAAALAVAIVGVLALLAVRLCIRRPGVWIVMLAIAAPIRLPISLGTDRSGNLLLPLYAVLVVGLVAYVWSGRRGTPDVAVGGGRSGATLLDVAVGMFTAFSIASTWWSDDIGEAVTKIVFFYLPFALVYWLIRNWWPRIADPETRLARATLAVAVVVAAVAVGQFVTSTIWWNDTLEQANIRNRFFRANGIFYDPNILGRFLMIAIVAALVYLWVARRGRHVAILTIALAVMAAGLVVTFSQSSAVGLIVAIALVALRLAGWRRTVLIGALALVGFGAPAIVLSDGVREKVSSVKGLASGGGGRLDLVKGGIDLWETAPVTGIGLGAFAERYRETFTQRDRARTRVFVSHTAPVTVLAELGIVGFGLFLLVCIAVVATLWRASRPRDGTGLAAWVVLAVVAGIFVHALFYSGLFEDPYIWILCGLGAALATSRVPAAAREATARLGPVGHAVAS
jgi:putative inorganic carbon (HCO3(-)) transporter